ncbi:MAG: CHAT domain-containing protein, partial [Streptosporangiaceae bacterium]
VLQAATTGAGVEGVLRAAGHQGLADEWAEHASRGGRSGAGQQNPGQQDPGEAGTDLRYRVMLAIEQSPAEARLLSPPALTEITAALTATGTDALVYLLPRDDDGAGMAVVVHQDGTVGRLPLPGLYVGDRSPVREFLRARQAADAAEAAARLAKTADAAEAAAQAAVARDAWLETLGALSGWAWQAAVGPVLGAIAGRDDGTQRRIVLMPVGELGLVPWHAARRPGSDDRYACQSAVFSYASSARQFVETARHRPRQWPQAPVLISDAGRGSLYVTSAGIAHLCDAYYGGAAVFGDARDRIAGTVPGSPLATRADVLAALPRAGVPGASLLHFGCHGRVQVPALGSSLRLGGDEDDAEARVEVRDILRQSRSRGASDQAATESGGLVVLASCLTDVTEHDFDEALSLATAFLSAGAVGVVAARWSVGAAETAIFMNVFHQFLNDGHPHPARALYETQKWMLDPDRCVPDNWPKVLRDEAVMAGRPGYPDLANPEAWAGFAYQGW